MGSGYVMNSFAFSLSGCGVCSVWMCVKCLKVVTWYHSLNRWKK